MAEWNLPFIGHGGDYNPDQWRHIPGTLDEDVRLMTLAGVNLVSVGIFAWAALEPEEGKYDFDWLDEVFDKLHKNGVSIMLATPTGARPHWMSQKYPEVLRVSDTGQRFLHGERHNHCFTSPIYREFTRKINTALAERYGNHPAMVGWHISNEYHGECHCDLCQAEFRKFVKNKYKTLDALNQAWWSGFWAKTITDWEQVHSPTPVGETNVHGLNLDWMRFVTARTVDFMRAEIEPIRRICPDMPVTTNFHGMGLIEGLDYFKFEEVMDVASFDSYPLWGSGDDLDIALRAGFSYDCTRSVLGKPWLLLESTPSHTNWQEVGKLKRPGVHLLSSMQAVAHGADSVEYFQWRKSLGSCEKFHGAVVDHVGHENTRVFRDVAELGQHLLKIAPVAGSKTPAQTALIFDWENRWAVNDAKGPRRDKQYEETVMEHYSALRKIGLDVDIIDQGKDFSAYKLIVAPMLYLIKPGVAEKFKRFVENGGTLLMTYWSGIVDENDLCFRTGFPGPLRKLAGVWAEEIDALYPGESNTIQMNQDNELGITGNYKCGFLLDLLHAETADVQAVYGKDFYAGRPALTRNKVGKGSCWYLAARTQVPFLQQLYTALIKQAGIAPVLTNLPEGVLASSREKLGERFVFVMNFADSSRLVTLPESTNCITGESAQGVTTLSPKQVLTLKI